MALDAGSVFVTLGGRFSPAGFTSFGAATARAGAQMRKAEAEIVASQRGITSATRANEASMLASHRNVERSSARLGSSLAGVGAVAKGGALAGVAALAGGLYEAVKVSVDFEKSMRNVNSIAGLSEPKFKALSKSVLELSGKTAQAPKTLAEGLYQLVSSGFNATDSLTILKSSAKAATAGLTDTETATTAVAAALNSYHEPASKAAAISDILFQTVNRGVISFPELAHTIGTVLPFASSLHIGLNQVGASISTLTKEGIPAAEATTYLKNAMVQFLKPSDALSAGIKKTGFASGEALVKAKGFQGALNAVAKTTDGTKGALQKMFPDIRASAAVFALTGKNAKTAAEDLRNFSAAATTGATAKVFAEQSKSVSFQVQQLKANLSVLGVEIGTALLPPLRDATAAASKFVHQMNTGTGTGGGFVAGLKHDLDGLLGTISTVVDASKIMLQALNFGDKALGGRGFDKEIASLQSFSDGINHIREGLRKGRGVDFSVKVNAASALAAITAIRGQKIGAKVVKVVSNGDTSVAQKIKALIALGIPPKTARILAAGIPQTLAGISAVAGALGGLPSLKTVNIHTLFTQSGNPSPGTSSVSKRPPVKLGHKATGRAPGGAETALVGEGHGPELVTDGINSYVVSKPTIVSLSPEDAVIPFGDRSQSGRALGLLLGMLGIQGYARGKHPKHRKGAAPSAQALPIPDAVTFAAVPEDDLANTRDHARDDYQKRKDTVHNLDVKIRDQRKKVSGAKAGKARNAARAKLSDLEKDRRRYQNGEGQLQSLTQMRKAWQDLEAQVKVLHATNQEIERLNTVQDTDRTKMATASKTGDEPAWLAAKKDRAGILADLRKRYAKALGLAKPGSNFQAELEGKLAGIEGDIADAAGETFDFTAASPFDSSGLTVAEKAQLDALDAGVSLAALTAGLDDDTAAAGAKQGFLENLLAAAQSDPARGGNSVIAGLADQVKAARDNVASLTGGASSGATNADPNLQAQIAQRDQQIAVLTETSRINAAGLAAFRGAGDIGSAGWRPSITINTLHPGDPATLTAIGNAAVSGINLQPFQPSTRTNLGI